MAGCPRQVYEYKFQDEQGMLTAHGDANGTSNASDRRSNASSNYNKSWSKSQWLTAQSLAESEANGVPICDPRRG